MKQLLDAWRDILAEDLRGFADRGTEPEFENDGNTLSATWQVRGHEHEALFDLDSTRSLRWVTGPSGNDPYSAFLRSDLMADFDQLASACKATIERQEDFVASEALIDDGLQPSSEVLTPQALSEVADNARSQAEGLTSLFFLKGDAGAGKTTLLREATALQAERYLEGQSDFLFFYVSAQGRELSNLRDAFSGELDDLRAAFTRDAVATLTRAGALIPIVDGFDELLGTAGYSGAFSSLQSLLTELDALGTLVVSARSAFYDIEFLGRSSGRSSETDLGITTVELMPWSDSQLREYLIRDRAGQDPAKTLEACENLSSSDRELLRRPFFASQFEVFVTRAHASDESRLLEHLITAYIDREAEKIVNANGDPVLPPDGHRHLFELAVSEMWEGEGRQLSGDDLRTIAELVSERFGLDADQASQLRAKVTSYAGFRPRRGRHHSQANFAFEHEVYFDYFLGSAIQRLLKDEYFEELVRFFDRGVIPESVLSASVAALPTNRRLDSSLLRCSTGIAFENRRRNLGGLLLAYAREVEPVTAVTVQGLAFVDVASGAARFRETTFSDCQFISADLRGVDFEACDGEASNFDGIKLDATSKMDIRGLSPGVNIRSVSDEPHGQAYAPEAISGMLEQLGAPIDEKKPETPQYSAKAQELIKLLERAARAYARSKILYEGEHQNPSLLSSPLWPELKQLLLKHALISKEMRESRGANVPGYRLRVNVDELLSGQAGDNRPQSATAGLWRDLQSM
ncbi:MAG TPA: NACHT domain-containing protein [Solirubrobacterales bacterium]